MKTGIIGLPQVGKSSLFRMLTKASVERARANPREAHIGVAQVPDDRLDRLAALYDPKKLVHASVEYVDVACSAGDPQPELVLQYSKLPQETLAQATACAQAPIANACTLAGAGASAKK